MEEQKNKIFQPKVIIGSITSFFVAAVCIVAVFFPSLLNLEKSRMPELKMEFTKAEDGKKLYDFLKKNINKPVKLEINFSAYPFGSERVFIETYLKGNKHDERCHIERSTKEGCEEEFKSIIPNTCPTSKEYDDFLRKVISHFGKNIINADLTESWDHEQEKDKQFLQNNLDMIVSGIGDLSYDVENCVFGFELEKGGLAFEYLDNDQVDWYGINTPYDSQKGKKYLFTDSRLSGFFYVHEEKDDTDGITWELDHIIESEIYMVDHQIIELEPLDKKDLELRNY